MTTHANLPPTHHFNGRGYRQHNGVVYVWVFSTEPGDSGWRWVALSNKFKNYEQAEQWLDAQVVRGVISKLAGELV